MTLRSDSTISWNGIGTKFKKTLKQSKNEFSFISAPPFAIELQERPLSIYFHARLSSMNQFIVMLISASYFSYMFIKNSGTEFRVQLSVKNRFYLIIVGTEGL